MYKRILVPLDGSELSEDVLPYARALAKTLKLAVELLHVIDPETLISSVIAQPGLDHDVLTAETEYKSDYLKKVATSLSEPSAIHCHVEIGKPAEVIIDRSAIDSETLISMTTHGHSGTKRWLLGSIAEKVLQATTNHLLLVRASEESKSIGVASFKSVLVPLDGSALAESVLPHVMELAGKMNLEIVLLRVFGLPADYHPERYWAVERVRKMVRDDAKHYLEVKVKQLQSEGLLRVSSVLLEGSAAEQIINLAQNTPQNLVAMCTHGRTGIRWLLGSVTDRVIRHSGNPMLVVRASTEAAH